MGHHVVVEMLGWFVTVCFLVTPLLAYVSRLGPMVFTLKFVKVYYIVLITMALVLEIVRVTLAHVFPTQSWIQRPTGSTCNHLGITWAYSGGMPSGHEAATAFAFTLLVFAFPGVWSVLTLIAASVTIYLFRYLALCHNPPQLIAGWLIGFIVALVTRAYIQLRSK